MKYRIKPFLITEESKYQTLFTEITGLSITELNGILEDFENVFSGKYDASSFSGNVSIVEFDKVNSKISHFDEPIGEEPTNEIYIMLMKYRNALVAFENKN
jgi:hypothetical protein